MTCAESAERISELLDGLPGDALETHLSACPDCRAALESTRRANDALRQLPSLPWRPELTDAILRRARRRSAWPYAVGLAAALLLAVALWPRPLPEAHVAALRCVAEQEGLERLSPEVLESQLRQLPDLDPRPPEDGRAIRRAWEAARADCGPARVVPPAEPSDVDLYAAGRLHRANGSAAAAVACFEGVLGRPSSAYADAACVQLAEHFAGAGDPVSALAFYASIGRPESLTEDLAGAIRAVGVRAGRAFVGPLPLDDADLATLRRAAAARTPYGLVRGQELWLLGAVKPGLARLEAPFSCFSLVERRVRVDPAAAPSDPLLGEMLRAMRGR